MCVLQITMENDGIPITKAFSLRCAFILNFKSLNSVYLVIILNINAISTSLSYGNIVVRLMLTFCL